MNRIRSLRQIDAQVAAGVRAAEKQNLILCPPIWIAVRSVTSVSASLACAGRSIAAFDVGWM